MFDLPGGPGPLHRKLTTAIRTAIRSGRLPRGVALPPSRTLATSLGTSRWVVTQAYGQLVTEGYLSGKVGSATRVIWSDEGVRPIPTQAAPPRFDMRPNVSDLRAFPRRKWVEAIRFAAETASFDQLTFSEPGGQAHLRAILAAHLNRTRGAAVQPGTLSVFVGASQALLQVSRALAADGHTQMGMEDPGSVRLQQAARTSGLDLVGLPIDDDGLIVAALDDQPQLRAVCVGAAHQAATGCVLAPHRRAELLAWARRVGGLVIEDDYDVEFSYDRPALPTMQGTDPDRVALLGSMSKSLGPTVGVGWAAAPRRWVDAIRTSHEIPLLPPVLNQVALAYFMESGAYDRHLRTSRTRFRARRNALVAVLERSLPQCRIVGAAAGLHLLLELPSDVDAEAVMIAARRHDLFVSNLDEMRGKPDPDRPGLLLGFSNLADNVIEEAVTKLADVIAARPRR